MVTFYEPIKIRIETIVEGRFNPGFKKPGAREGLHIGLMRLRRKNLPEAGKPAKAGKAFGNCVWSGEGYGLS